MSLHLAWENAERMSLHLAWENADRISADEIKRPENYSTGRLSIETLFKHETRQGTTSQLAEKVNFEGYGL